MAPQVICFGEVLWDLLPSGEQPGGAPMNVAYHLKKLGIEPALISRVGHDDYGNRLLHLLQKWGLSTAFAQQDETHATGTVLAHLNERQEATYEIVQPVAWDFIAWDKDMQHLVQNAPYFVYGSLAARSELSRQSLSQLLRFANKKIFDINIRPPHFDRQQTEQLLQDVFIFKLNENELPLLSGWIGASGSLETQLAAVQDHFRIPIVVVTRGGDGAVLRSAGKLYTHKGYPVPVADTVGSGDAFLAGLLSRLHQGAPPEEALAFACATGALTATFPGACPGYESSAIERLIEQGSLQ